MNKIIGKNERHSLPFNSKFGFEVSKNVAKIYMKELEEKLETEMSAPGEIITVLKSWIIFNKCSPKEDMERFSSNPISY